MKCLVTGDEDVKTVKLVSVGSQMISHAAQEHDATDQSSCMSAFISSSSSSSFYLPVIQIHRNTMKNTVGKTYQAQRALTVA